MAATTTQRAVRIQCERVPVLRPHTRRTARVVRQFGLTETEPQTLFDPIDLPIRPKHIVGFTGPSASGKTTALAAIEAHFPAAHNVDRVIFPIGKPIVDCVAPSGSLADALHCLSWCGLGEARQWLREYTALSEGERFRARLARAVGAVTGRGAGALLIIDAFGDSLHRRAARAVAYNLRRLATRCGLAIVVATCHHDVLADLQPDTLVTLTGYGTARVQQEAPRWRPFSLWRNLRIETGRKRDYVRFADMHYRAAADLGFVDKIFVLRHRTSAEPLAIAVYAYPPASLALRNQATGGRFINNLDLLNREMRILRRLVVHPDLRGCGVAHRFVRRTLPLVGTRYVECLASMGAVNPVFERAGMKRIGECPTERRAAALLARLRELDVDPFSSEFETQVCRRPQVRDIAAQIVARWYEATCGQGRCRVRRQSPHVIARICRSLASDNPLYYLWQRKKVAEDD